MTKRAVRNTRRRSVVALSIVLAILAGFVVRLVDIQVVNADEHRLDALRLSLGAERTIYASRGSIVDADGNVLAGAVTRWDFALNPMLIQASIDAKTPPKVTWAEAAPQIAEIIGRTEEDLLKLVSDAIAANKENQYLPLGSIDAAQYDKLRKLGVNSYLDLQSHPARVYPDGAVAANVVGFVRSDGIAAAGLEQMYDECLAATDGVELYEKGGNGVMLPGSQVVETPAEDGGVLQTTIDRDLQWYLQQLIAEETVNQGAKEGNILVVEVKTGKIRAAAEYPTYDANDFGSATETERRNKIFTDQFEPGSTFKAVTAAAVIELGGVKPTDSVYAPARQVFPNGAIVNDAAPHPDWNYTLAGALIDSSNVAISTFGGSLSAEARYDFLAKFGVGKPTAVGFLGEATGGQLPPERWDNQTFYTTAFGQAFEVTVPQVASVYQTIANGGLQMPLQLVESCTKPDGTVIEYPQPKPEQIIEQSTADQVTDILENVSVQGGLASAIAVPGYRIATKTGTAQFVENGQYVPGLYRTSLTGFAPADDPQYVVIVTLNQPTRVTSSAANAPAFQKAMTQVLKAFNVQPSGTELEELFPKTN